MTTVAIAVCIFAHTASAEVGATYKILKTVDHDPSYYTQGLEVDGTTMLESSGLYRRSKIRRFDLNSGATLQEKKLPGNIFAEGLTLVGDQLYLLTWKARKYYRLDPTTLEILSEGHYKTEGWGLTHNDDALIMSDGTHQITFRDKKSFAPLHTINVTVGGKKVFFINELEYAKGYIWANIYQTPKIIAINPLNGNVMHVFDFSEIAKRHTDRALNNVLNGIAYAKELDAFWITGKLWPKAYLVKFSVPELVQETKHKTQP